MPKKKKFYDGFPPVDTSKLPPPPAPPAKKTIHIHHGESVLISENVEDTKVDLPGGAQRSKIELPFHLVPSALLRSAATRFQLGAQKYGENQWKNSIMNTTNAKVFATEAYNHMVEHMLNMKDGSPTDDDLSAIAWAVAVLAHIEEMYGCKWTQL